MDLTTPTAYGLALQNNLLLGLPHTYPANSTLNEKLSILQNTLPTSAQNPVARYFCIGNNGHKFSCSGTGVSKNTPRQHQPTDGAPFNLIPLVLRPAGNDLTPAQRINYRLRRAEEHNGAQYIAYYAKKMSVTNVSTQMEFKIKNQATGAFTPEPFVPSIANLNPVPLDLNVDGITTVSGDYVGAAARLIMSLSADEIQEFLDATSIIYNESGYGIISEIEIVSGVDKDIAIESNVNFTEIIGAQVVQHITCNYDMNFINSEWNQILNMGNWLPLLKLVPNP